MKRRPDLIEWLILFALALGAVFCIGAAVYAVSELVRLAR